MKSIVKVIVILLFLTSNHAWAQLSFTDITVTSQVGGPTGDGAGGHGAMWADLTSDDLPDLYMPFNRGSTHALPDYFYLNQGNGIFVEESQQRGIDDLDGGSHGACFADLDNDGDFDLLNGTTYQSINSGIHNDIFKNTGNGQFSRITGTALDYTNGETRAILSFDMDSDGDLDIFAVNGYVGTGEGDLNELYRNDGNFHFTKITGDPLQSCPAGQGATDTDFDGDGDIDILAANRNGNVNILINNGTGQFTLINPNSIGIYHSAKDGITTADIDNDGDLDLLLAGDGTAELYINKGFGNFEHRQHFSNPGYMGGFADLDNDSDMDLLFPGNKDVYLNNGTGIFITGPIIPGGSLIDPRAVSFADIDDDGDIDFLYSGKLSQNQLYQNNFNSGHWLKVELRASNGQIGAYGAKVFVYSRNDNGENNRLIGFREAKSNEGYLVQNDPTLHFGLGGETLVNVHVQFLGGKEIVWKGIRADKKVFLDAANPNKAYSSALTGSYLLLLKK